MSNNIVKDRHATQFKYLALQMMKRLSFGPSSVGWKYFLGSSDANLDEIICEEFCPYRKATQLTYSTA